MDDRAWLFFEGGEGKQRGVGEGRSGAVEERLEGTKGRPAPGVQLTAERGPSGLKGIDRVREECEW